MSYPKLEEIPPRLKRLREAAGLSQQTVAERAGVNIMTLGRWENGKTEVKMSELTKLAEVLGVSFEQILFGGEIEVPIPESLVEFFAKPEGQALTSAQQRALALLLHGVSDVDEGKLRSALVLLLGEPTAKR